MMNIFRARISSDVVVPKNSNIRSRNYSKLKSPSKNNVLRTNKDVDKCKKKQIAPTKASPPFKSCSLKNDDAAKDEENTTVVTVTHINLFLYLTCYWISNAVFPYLSKRMGADPVMFGYLQTTFDFLQMTGTLMFGRLTDFIGIRLAMMLAFSACACSYFCLYVAVSLPILFLSRVPSIFMHVLHGSQLIVTDVSDHKGRANALATLGFFGNLGMVTGRMTGGVVAKAYNLETAALVACLVSLISALLVYTHIPSRITKAKCKDAARQSQEPKTDTVFSIWKTFQTLKAPGVLFLMTIKIGIEIPMCIFQRMFGLIALETFNMSADKNGYMTSYIGVLAMIVQAYAISYAAKRYSDITILAGAAALSCVSFLFMAYVTTTWQLCLVFLPLSIGQTFQSVITTTALTNTVSGSDTGAMLGLSMATTSLIRVLAPTIGGYMLEDLGFASFGYLGFVANAIVMMILVVKLNKNDGHDSRAGGQGRQDHEIIIKGK